MNFFKAILLLCITIPSLHASDTVTPTSSLESLAKFNNNQQALTEFKNQTELVTIGMQQKALENLLALSEKFNRTNQLSNQTSLVEQQIQIKALEKLTELAEKLDKKPEKKDSPKFSIKKLKDPVYLLDQIAAGILHVSGRMYDKCETVLISTVTYSLILYIFFPGVWKAACTTYQILGLIDGVVGTIFGSVDIMLGTITAFYWIAPQYLINAGPYVFNGVRALLGF